MIYGLYAFKGGVGKSTLAGALGTCPAVERRVIVSLDPQMDVVLGLGMMASPESRQTVSAAAAEFDDLLHGRPLAAGASGSAELPDGTRLVVNLGDLEDVEPDALRRLLEKSGKTRHIFIDMPPRDGRVVAVGLAACDVVIVPTTLDEYGLAGVMRSIVAVRRLVPDRKPRIAVLRNRIAGRRDTAAKSVAARLEELCAKQGAALLETQIRERATYRTAQNRHVTIWSIDSFYAGDAQSDVSALAAELLAMEEK